MPPPEWVVEHWPGSATIIALRSHGTRDGKPTDETRYYVTSLRTSAKALLQHVRDRWSIENSWQVGVFRVGRPVARIKALQLSPQLPPDCQSAAAHVIALALIGQA
jgi:hypothetical protein